MWMRVRTGEDAGREVTLEAGRPLVLGRARGSDVVVRCPRASRRHAEVRPLAGGRVLLRDLGSTNGTWVGADRVAEAVLSEGDEVTVGDVSFGITAAATPPTLSAIGRMVESRARRSNRFAGFVAGGAALLAASAGAALVFGPLDAFGGADGPERVPQVVARTAPSTVLVEASRAGSRSGTGSGWVLDAAAGLVVTNAHVLNQGDTIAIAAGGRRRAARVVGAAPCDDVALLRVADTGGLRSATLGRDAAVRQGETVVALGYPDGAAVSDDLTSTTGVVSVAHTRYADTGPDVPAYADAVQTDTALNPGNSGGPLVDLQGRLVGMNAAVRTSGADGRALQNQNYAIAVDRLRAVVDGLRRGAPVAGWTGLTFAYPSPELLATRRLPSGLLVTGALTGSPAARAGLGATAEALVAGDDRPVGTTLRSYCEAAAAHAGAPASVSLARSGTGRVRRVALPAVAQ